MSIDIDVNDPRPPTPCRTDGCGHPRFHVCAFGKPDLFPQLLGQLKARKKQKNRGHWINNENLDEVLENMSLAQRDRREREKEENRERDNKVVDRYAKGDIGMHGLSKEFGIAVNVVRDILKEAEAAGRIAIRQPGQRPDRRNRELEDRVINRYNEGGIGMEPLAVELGLTRDVVRKILIRARDEGRVTIRSRGHTVAKGAA